MSNIPKLVLEKKYRDGKNYKNTEIAESLNLSEAMVSRFMNNKINMGKVTFDTILAWSKWLDCDPRVLVHEQNDN